MTDATPAVPPATPPATPSGPWYGKFADKSVLDHATTKGWATPEDAVRSNLELEKLIGVPKEQLIRLPKADATPEDWNPVYDQLGRPKTPDEYGLEVPAGADDSYSKHIAKIMHENGLTKAQATKVAKGQAEYVAGKVAEQTEARKTKTTLEHTELTKEWGVAYDKNVQITQAAARKFGITDDIIDNLEDSMGFKATMVFLHKLGSSLGEDSFESPGHGGKFAGLMEPAQAQARISALKKDSGWSAKYLAGDVGARAEMENLQKMAYPEE